MPVRGDIITSDRYISDAFMARENELLWPYVWHLGGMMAELQEELVEEVNDLLPK